MKPKRSKPTKGNHPKKATIRDATKQVAGSSEPKGSRSLAERENELAEAIRQARWSREHGDEYRSRLLQNIKHALPKLEMLLAGLELEEALEDVVYRFYHGSYKLYGSQWGTTQIVHALKELLPDRPLNRWFSRIVAEGTGHKLEDQNDDNWFTTARAILEAFFHAYYFLEMVVKYGRELEAPPDAMPSGWAAVLYLYDLR